MDQETMNTAVAVIERAFNEAGRLTGSYEGKLILTKLIAQAYYNEQYSFDPEDEDWS